MLRSVMLLLEEVLRLESLVRGLRGERSEVLLLARVRLESVGKRRGKAGLRLRAVRERS